MLLILALLGALIIWVSVAFTLGRFIGKAIHLADIHENRNHNHNPNHNPKDGSSR